MQEEALLTGPELCQILKISAHTLVTMVKNGTIERIVLAGRTFRYKRSDVDRMIKGLPARKLDGKGFCLYPTTQLYRKANR